MNRQPPPIATVTLLCAIMMASAAAGRAAETPGAAAAGEVKTGEIDLTFTQRSPLSTRKELARRLSLKETDLGDDYDLSQRPFKAYVPGNYDAATPQGIVVYLGYKDTVSSPPDWRPFLDDSHLIFISPVCHTGDHYMPQVPLWQTVGLALDAVYNLKQQYSINAKRIYIMTWDMQAALSTADIGDGLIVTYDDNYFVRMALPDGRYFKPEFPPPPDDLLQAAKRHGVFIISPPPGDGPQAAPLRLAIMKQQGFAHVTLVNLSVTDDLHFPNFKLDWFQKQAIPFLDSASAGQLDAATTASPVAAKAAPVPTPTASVKPAAPEPSPAAHLLALAKLYLNNNQPDAARTKLQQIIDEYPTDPAATTAKQMIESMGN
ncbi:MAG: hypothetical protein ABSH22_13315 [Tepidisphaeraceae bacterium]|jgi:hypothetical protein